MRIDESYKLFKRCYYTIKAMTKRERFVAWVVNVLKNPHKSMSQRRSFDLEDSSGVNSREESKRQ